MFLLSDRTKLIFNLNKKETLNINMAYKIIEKKRTYLLNRSSCLIFFNLVNSSSELSVSEPPILILSPPANSSGLAVTGAE